MERMSLLAAAASDEGGITGFLLDLVEKLGPVGVGLSILAETVIPPIPSEAVLGLAGVLINEGRMSIVPVILFATLGSVLGAIFFYYVGRALGPRRSHAFLDRLPLVETADVDQTFAWFERHGRSAVFFGRMVPIVRSFISVPAGVVRMPLGQFLLFTTARQPDLEHRAHRPGRRRRRLRPGQPQVPGLRRGRGRRRWASATWSTSGRRTCAGTAAARAAGRVPAADERRPRPA